MYLRQMWQDKRLSFDAPVKDLTIDVGYLKAIWVPDTFFPNEKKSFFHTATTHNSFLRIDREGNIVTSQRYAQFNYRTHCSPFSFQDYTLDFYLRQMWTDPRLSFENNEVSAEVL